MSEVVEQQEQNKSVTSDKKKAKTTKKSSLPIPAQILLIMFCGGQLAYLIGASITTGLSDALLDPDTCRQLDWFFIPESYPFARKLLSSAQFLVRSGICAFAVGGMTGFLFLCGGFVGLAGFGYFYLFSDGRPNLLTKHRYDISATFALGSALGWTLYQNWSSVPLLGQWFDTENASHLILGGLVSIAVGLGQLAAQIDKKEEESKKNKDIAAGASSSSIADEVLNATKVGTVTTSLDGENTTTQDISAADAVNFVKNVSGAAHGDDKNSSEVQKWINRKDNVMWQLCRVSCGVSFGFLCGIGYSIFSLSVYPFVNGFFGGENLLLNYWKHGMRTAFQMEEFKKQGGKIY